jgi:hypothetical protein
MHVVMGAAVFDAAVFKAAGLDPNSVSPGLLGFIIVVLIGLVTWFLAKSMVKQLRKLDANRPEEEGMEAEEPDVASQSTVSKNTAPSNTASKNTASNGAH